METTTKLESGQKHILRLIARDKKEDGWTTVSAQLYKVVSASIPAELATPEQARRLYTQAARILRACPRSTDWLEASRINNLIQEAEYNASL